MILNTAHAAGLVPEVEVGVAVDGVVRVGVNFPRVWVAPQPLSITSGTISSSGLENIAFPFDLSGHRGLYGGVRLHRRVTPEDAPQEPEQGLGEPGHGYAAHGSWKCGPSFSDFQSPPHSIGRLSSPAAAFMALAILA